MRTPGIKWLPGSPWPPFPYGTASDQGPSLRGTDAFWRLGSHHSMWLVYKETQIGPQCAPQFIKDAGKLRATGSVWGACNVHSSAWFLKHPVSITSWRKWNSFYLLITEKRDPSNETHLLVTFSNVSGQRLVPPSWGQILRMLAQARAQDYWVMVLRWHFQHDRAETQGSHCLMEGPLSSFAYFSNF